MLIMAKQACSRLVCRVAASSNKGIKPIATGNACATPFVSIAIGHHLKSAYAGRWASKTKWNYYGKAK
jgi:hypothetical protein